MSKLYNEIQLDNPKSRVLHFCRSIGIGSNSTIEDMFNFSNGFFKGSGGMNTDSLLKITQTYPQLNLDWVICGRGDMIFRGEGMVAQAQAKYSGSSTMSKQAIKVFDDINSFEQQSELLPSKWYMADPSMTRSEQDTLVKIADEALAPFYLKGEYALVSKLPKAQWEDLLNTKRLFLLVIKDSGAVISTVDYLQGSHSVLTLSFLNADKGSFPDILIPKSSIVEMWEVVTVLKF